MDRLPEIELDDYNAAAELATVPIVIDTEVVDCDE